MATVSKSRRSLVVAPSHFVTLIEPAGDSCKTQKKVFGSAGAAEAYKRSYRPHPEGMRPRRLRFEAIASEERFIVARSDFHDYVAIPGPHDNDGEPKDRWENELFAAIDGRPAPRSLVDFVPTCPVSTEGNGGIDKLLTREKAFEIAAEWNREQLQEIADGSCSATQQCDWWIVLECGQQLDGPAYHINIDGCGIGVQQFTLERVVRIVPATEAEHARYPLPTEAAKVGAA